MVAAYLHDVGCAPVLAISGFHLLDGGRHVRELGPERLTALVAHRSGAAEEALLRDLSEALGEFQREDSDLGRLLDYCDLLEVESLLRRVGRLKVVSEGVVGLAWGSLAAYCLPGVR
jgi:hypothetical protein